MLVSRVFLTVGDQNSICKDQGERIAEATSCPACPPASGLLEPCSLLNNSKVRERTFTLNQDYPRTFHQVVSQVGRPIDGPLAFLL